MTTNTLRENIQKYYDPVEMPGGWFHVLPSTLNTIELYYNGKFKTGPFDARGFRKFFYNINKPPCDIATKFVDLDTQNFLIQSEFDGDEFTAFLLKKDLHQYMKDTNFASLLNENSVNLPKYGHIVNKKSKDGWKNVPLQNLRMDPSISKLEKGSFVYELHVMSRAEIENSGWDGELNELFSRGETDKYYIYETYHKDGGWKRTIYGDVFTYIDKDGHLTRSVEAVINQDDLDELPPLVLDGEKKVKLPYRESKWESVSGRWLGLGFVEYLEDDQVATNEAENLERKGLMYSSLHIWQTRDEMIGGSNVLTDSENGDILKVSSEVTPVDMSERNLAAYNSTRNRWETSIQRKTFSFPVASGQLEQLPSRTPLGAISLSTGMVTSYFDFKREEYGIFLRNLVLNDILPDFKDRSRGEHILTFFGTEKDIDEFDDHLTKLLINLAVAKEAEKTGFFPSVLQREKTADSIRAKLRQRGGRHAKVPEGLYDNIRYRVDVITTGEQVDLGRKGQVIQLALQLVGSNPAILQNEGTRALFLSLLEVGGVNPHELGIKNFEGPPLPQGGSVSGPQPTPSIDNAVVGQ